MSNLAREPNRESVTEGIVIVSAGAHKCGSSGHAGALGFTTVHTVVDHAALKHYGLKVIAKVEECGSDFYAITAERRGSTRQPLRSPSTHIHSSSRERHRRRVVRCDKKLGYP